MVFFFSNINIGWFCEITYHSKIDAKTKNKILRLSKKLLLDTSWREIQLKKSIFKTDNKKRKIQ